jgi:hypothetical protein
MSLRQTLKCQAPLYSIIFKVILPYWHITMSFLNMLFTKITMNKMTVDGATIGDIYKNDMIK